MNSSADTMRHTSPASFLELAKGRRVFLFGSDDEVPWAADFCARNRVPVCAIIRDCAGPGIDPATALPIVPLAGFRASGETELVVLIADPNIFEVGERLRDMGVALYFSSRLFLARYFDFSQNTTVRIIEFTPDPGGSSETTTS